MIKRIAQCDESREAQEGEVLNGYAVVQVAGIVTEGMPRTDKKIVLGEIEPLAAARALCYFAIVELSPGRINPDAAFGANPVDFLSLQDQLLDRVFGKAA